MPRSYRAESFTWTGFQLAFFLGQMAFRSLCLPISPAVDVP